MIEKKLIDKIYPLSDFTFDQLSQFCEKVDQDIIEKLSPEILKIFDHSKFLTRWMIKNPKFSSAILKSRWIEKHKIQSDFHQDVEAFYSQNLEELSNSLRIYKYQELLRITIKDFKFGTNSEVLAELSYLAYTILKIVSDKIYSELKNKYELPRDKNNQPIDYCILAMGKLGGNELNYSSDIDLIPFVSTFDEKYNLNENSKSVKEFFSIFIKKLTQFMEEYTEEGFLYRVDWDLRPESKAGPLINSLGSLHHYYETFGADWERQAYIKARPAAGNLELGNHFLKSLEPFIYRKYFDIESIDRILSMKKKIHHEIIKKPREEFNVKLGIGGIREIEFFVQAFLLIYGGKQIKLRSKNTIETIHNLHKFNLMDKSDAQILEEDYLFLRSIEHRLQIIDEKQTHHLSQDPEKRMEIAKSLNDKNHQYSLEEFNQKLESVTLRVNQKFEKLFSPEQSDTIESAQAFRLPPSLVPKLKSIKDELQNRLSRKESYEEKIYELRNFKNQSIENLHTEEKLPNTDRKNQCIQLTLIAEAIIQEALSIATQELEPKFGKPYFIEGKNKKPSYLLILGMGKVGSYELNYGSDLDVIFIYSENGFTDGPKSITNQEYFAKLVQKIISIVSMNTIGGKCYEIDTELRPSGHFGPLVTSFESFLNYQNQEAQLWEKQALLRARPIAGAYEFSNMVIHQLDSLLYKKTFTSEIKSEMNRLRMRVEHELAKELNDIIDFKLGSGGIMDIEFIIAYFQLTQGSKYIELQNNNTFDLLENFKKLNFLSQFERVFLEQAYLFYRNLETKIYLQSHKSQHKISLKNPIFSDIAPLLNQEDKNKLTQQILDVKSKCREIYLQIFKS